MKFECVPNPIQGIDNCKSYKEYRVCLECENLYYLSKQNKCIKIKYE